MTEKLPGIFSSHYKTNLRFFDRISEAQDWAESQGPGAVIRKEYGRGWVDIAKWNGEQWSYSHQKTKRLTK